MNCALIAAAGSGSRLAHRGDKLFVKVKGVPLMIYTIERFVDHAEIDQVVVMTREDRVEEVKLLLNEWFPEKEIPVIAGGESRQASVAKGVEFLGNLEKKPEVVMVHNGANPLVTYEEISGSLKAAREHGAVVVGRPVVNTLKTFEGDQIGKTIPRDGMCEVQTPQTIKYDLFCEALAAAERDGFVGTDDVSLVERMNRPVKYLLASEFNFKITYEKDLEFFTYLLSNDDVTNWNWAGQPSSGRDDHGTGDRGSDRGGSAEA